MCFALFLEKKSLVTVTLNFINIVFLCGFVALEQVSKYILPLTVHKLLFGPMSDFPVVRRAVGAVFGALSGAGE